MSGHDPSGTTLISVVLCTYNGSRFLAEQLDSVLAQTYANVEVIASDDGSSDATLAILRRYAAVDARVRVLVNAQNVGFDRNFEQALRNSRGDLIAPCDQDDIWLPEKLATLKDEIGAHSMAYCDSELIDEHGAALGSSMSRVVPMMSLDDPAPFAFGNCVSGHAMLFRREVLERAFPVPPGFFYDWWLAAVAASMNGVLFCDSKLVLYRQHGANVTSHRFGQMLNEAGLQPIRLGARTALLSPHQRAGGHRLRYFRETEQRLASLADLPGQHQFFLKELHALWRARLSQWLSPRLWSFIRRHKDRLLALTKMSEKDRTRYCREFLWGVRLKRLTRGRAYRAE